MAPLWVIPRKVKASYKLGNKEYKLNHLLFMDELKLFSKSEYQSDTLVRTVHFFRTDIGMEVWNEKMWNSYHGERKSSYMGRNKVPK